jgi:iron complex outermembrane recepter protein
MAFSVIPLLLSFTMSSVTHAADRLDRESQFDISAQPMSSALVQFAKQAELQLITASVDLGKLSSPGVAGKLRARRALEKVLERSGLTYSLVGENTVAISGVQKASIDARPGSTTNAVVPSPDSHSDSGTPGFSEIIVTAQKRTERLEDVPVPVTVISAQTLVDTNQFRLQDYYNTVPGLNFSMDNRGSPSMSIRGITTGAYVTPTVGTTIDDVPFGSTVVISSFSPSPDVDPNELARIEVLRGPQGTLYGASSIGGLIKYVTVDPSTDALGGRVQIGGETIHNGSGAGYNVSASINIPVNDTLALRANGFTHRDPGYVDNVETGQDGVNRTTTSGGRLAALWRPSELVTVKLNALIQESKADGSSQEDLNSGLGDLQQRYLLDTGGYDRKVQGYSANVTAKLGEAELTSITGYGHSTAQDSYDVTAGLGVLTQTYYGVGGVAWIEDNESRKFTQELRLAMPLASRVDWLFGLFYTDEHSNPDGGFELIDPVTYEHVSQALNQQIHSTYQEYAAFTDFTVRITDNFDIQLGGRESHNKQTYLIATSAEPPYILGSNAVSPVAPSKDNAFTYLLTPRLKLSPDLMAYARFASGYRPGGPNAPGVGIPSTFAPDKTQNYELGTKADFLDHRLSLDASLYYIRWQDIQLALLNADFLEFTGNASRAKSDGVELSVQAKPFTGTTLSSWIVWNDAHLTAAVPTKASAFGSEGDRLPYSSRISGNLSLRQEFPLPNNITGFVGGSLAYVGNRFGEFASIFSGSPQRQVYPGFARTDLSTGLRYDDWSVNLFVDNVADKRGLLGGGIATVPAFAFNVIQPRTVGLNLARRF